MKQEDINFCWFVVGLVVGLLIMGIPLNHAMKTFQQTAIEHNAAHWEVNKDGSTNFKWN